MLAISVNDMLIKQLSGGYPLHQMVFVRSVIGIVFTCMLVQWEGGFAILKTAQPGLQALRGLLIVCSNLSYFSALAVLSLAEATAIFFVAPLLITLFSIPFLGERVGPWRLGAVAIGFVGVLVMIEPWKDTSTRDVEIAIAMLPLAGAVTYALNQILTRRLGATTKASALAFYIQATFIIVALCFWIVAGDGRYAEAVDSPSLRFLLRAWVWPEDTDLYLMLGLGLNSAVIGYAISAAYKMADAATVAPFEYSGLPLAVMWGWVIWDELPGPNVTLGIVLIMGAGLFVFLRERQKGRAVASGRRVHRRY